ncbi:hypothetical protein [Aquisediminimonas sediminicola]|uniref:hypothetical protein n=1 Tax=Alteraquisediminimonas sediminicola TaxID=2676787 RepID=UPI001C8F1576|nr:hypothetical protein [Aquisediminimonas sediminicola]
MRESALSSPNIGALGYHLRRIAAQAVSYVQVNQYANGRHPSAVQLSAFLAEVKTAVDLLLPVDPVLAFTPSAKSYSIAAGVTAGPALAKGGSEGIVTYSSATPAKCTVNALTGAITPLTTGTSVITASVAASGGYNAKTVTYVATVTA